MIQVQIANYVMYMQRVVPQVIINLVTALPLQQIDFRPVDQNLNK